MTRLRRLFAVLPLPMLALAASYGVYSYSSIFVPLWVAVIQAAAFEMTYIGLALTTDLDDRQRRRATMISIGAVVVSILYNTLAGLFHRNPAWLTAWGAWWEWTLAMLHGAPLAWVAYLVADLLLHSSHSSEQPALLLARQADYPAPMPMVEEAVLASTEARTACPRCGAELTTGQYGAAKRYGHCHACKED